MNALTLNMLVTQYWSPEPPKITSPAHADGINYLISYEMLDDRGHITEKGRVHVEALLAAPFPTNNWVPFQVQK